MTARRSRKLRSALVALAVAATVGAGCAGDGNPEGATQAPTTAAPSTTTTQRTTTTTAPDGAALQELADAFATDTAAALDEGGVIVAIASGPDTYLAAAGSQPDGTPVPGDGAWRIGSVTKPFTATLLLQLVDEGIVDLDAPVSTYLTRPELPESVTVRDLLGHTSGIFNYTDDIGFIPETLADLERRWDPVEIVERALSLREVDPDPTFAYSNTNYLLVGLIIEAVTGEPYQEVLADRIVTPLGLDATYLAGAGEGPAPVGAYTSGIGEPIALDASIPYTSFATGAWTAGAMVSDAADLIAFMRALFGGGLIGDDTLEAMLETGPDGYGLGISREPGLRSDVWGHGGLIAGYFTQVAHSPDHDVTVVVGLTTDAPPASVGRRFQQFLLTAISG